MGLFYFGLLFVGVIVGALIFVSRNTKTTPAVLFGLIILFGGMYFYLSSPVCSDIYGTIGDLERNSLMSSEDFFASRTERVGNFIWNAPMWSHDGDRVITCHSRFGSTFAIH